MKCLPKSLIFRSVLKRLCVETSDYAIWHFKAGRTLVVLETLSATKKNS